MATLIVDSINLYRVISDHFKAVFPSILLLLLLLLLTSSFVTWTSSNLFEIESGVSGPVDSFGMIIAGLKFPSQ